MAPLKPQESARGKPLDSALSTPAKTVLHALSKGVRAVSYCGFRSGLLLAAAAALRRGHEGVGLRRHRFFARKSGEKTREGAHPLNPAIGSLTIGRLHALRKGVRAISYCGFRFGLLLAAAAALRWGLKASAFGDTAFLREKAVRKRARGRTPSTPPSEA